MCTSIVARKKESRKPATTEERQARIDAFRNHFTEDDLARCRQAVRRWVWSYLGDPEEGLSHGLECAVTRYKGFGEISHFVREYAYNHMRTFYHRRVKHHYSIDAPLQDRRSGQDGEERTLGDCLSYCDPEVIEQVDPQLIERIRKALAGLVNQRIWHRRPSVIVAALKMLTELCESANRDQGIGVSEYDEAPLKIYLDSFERRVNPRDTKLARRAMYRHLAERFGVDPFTVKYAMTALRKSAEIALRERYAEE